MFNKGAMFGLDARIALAIFGALSVISGAALYSAIQQSKVTAIITEMNEVGKAYESYLLDIGSHVPQSTTSVTYKSIELLVDNKNSDPNWKGPYISYEQQSTTDYRLVHPTYDVLLIARFNDDNPWAGTEGSDYTSTGVCTGSETKCNLFIMLEYVDTNIAKEVDKQIDGSYDSRNGSVKLRNYTTGATSGKSTIYWRLLPESV
jgi:Tfp pilus assembly protein PilE